jgi:hypothetical protein
MKISTISIKKFLCLECDARLEAEAKDGVCENLTCLNCGSKKILPFPESDGLRLHHAKCGGDPNSDGCGKGGCSDCLYND